MCKIINYLLILSITITFVLGSVYSGWYTENGTRHNFYITANSFCNDFSVCCYYRSIQQPGIFPQEYYINCLNKNKIVINVTQNEGKLIFLPVQKKKKK